MEKKALGKGLGALLPSSKLTQPTEPADVQRIRIETIVPNRYQPRHTFPPEELAELAASIKESGVLQPIMVRRKGDGIYELIAGERRWRASKEAGLDTIPVVIRNTFAPEKPGTWIGKETDPAQPVKGVTTIAGLAIINIEGAGMIGVPGTAERAFSALKAAGASVVMISQGSSEHSICCVVQENEATVARTAVLGAFGREIAAGHIQDVTVETGIAALAAFALVACGGKGADILEGRPLEAFDFVQQPMIEIGADFLERRRKIGEIDDPARLWIRFSLERRLQREGMAVHARIGASARAAVKIVRGVERDRFRNAHLHVKTPSVYGMPISLCVCRERRQRGFALQ